MRTLRGHTDWVDGVAVVPDGDKVISTSHDQTLKVWDLKSGKELQTLRGHAREVNAVAVMPDGAGVLSASSDRTLKVWDLKSGKVAPSFTADGAIQACAVARDGMIIIAGDGLGTVHFLKLIVP